MSLFPKLQKGKAEFEVDAAVFLSDAIEDCPASVTIGHLMKPPNQFGHFPLRTDGIPKATQLRFSMPYMMKAVLFSLKKIALSLRKAR